MQEQAVKCQDNNTVLNEQRRIPCLGVKLCADICLRTLCNDNDLYWGNFFTYVVFEKDLCMYLCALRSEQIFRKLSWRQNVIVEV